MTAAAQLMSAGANQQLIASKLEEGNEIGPGAGRGNSDGTTDLAEGESTKLSREKPKPAPKKPAKKPRPADDGSLVISHEKQGSVDEVAAATAKEEQEAAARQAEEELAKTQAKGESPEAIAAEQDLARQLTQVAPAAAAKTPSLAELQKDIAEANKEVNQAAAARPASAPLIGPAETNTSLADKAAEPSFGGTLNATTEQAAEDKRHEIQNDQNRRILTHGGNSYVGNSSPVFQSPLNAANQPEYEEPPIDPFAPAAAAPMASPNEPVSYAPPMQPPNETLADLDAKTRTTHEEARAAVDAAYTQPAPAQPVPASASNLPPLPPMPDFSTLPPLPPSVPPPASTAPPTTSPQLSGALPPEKLEEVLGAPQASTQPSPAQPADPSQFRIPGQS